MIKTETIGAVYIGNLSTLTLTGKKWKYTYVIQLYLGLYMCVFLPKVVVFLPIFLLFLKIFLYLVKFGFLMRNQFS